MKILHLDWATFLDFLEPWQELTPAARRFLLDSKPKAVMPESTAGRHLSALLSGGFLKALSSGARVQLSGAFHETHEALRSFARHPLVEKPDPRSLREYLGDHFTNEERRAFLDSPYGHFGDHDAYLVEAITSAGHARGFLRAEDRRDWEQERLAQRGSSGERAWTQTAPLLAGKNAGADLACLIEALAAAKGPIPFRELSHRLPALSRARLANGIEAGLRYLLCFPAFDAELVPALLLWPGVAERLTRAPAPPPESVEPEDSFCLAFRMEDLTQLGDLDEQPDELQEIEEMLAEPDEDDDELVPFDPVTPRRSLTLSDETLFGAYGSRGLTKAAIQACAGIEPGRAVPFSAFLGHRAETANPFLTSEGSRTVSYLYGSRSVTEEKLGELWTLGLRRIFHRVLLPLGGARAGQTREGRLTIELTAVGRYVLGLAEDFALDAAAPIKTPVRVQPDFEIVFVAASPALEAAIGRFAERRGTGIGVLFRITRESILQAALSGLGPDDVLATLAGASTTGVPTNVEHEIRSWFASCRKLRLESVHLVRCPDAATAARVLAAGGGKLEALSDTVLVLTDPAHKAAVTRACRKAGLFLRSGPRAELQGRPSPAP